MRGALDPFSFVVISIAGWMNRRQQHVIEYLIEENRVLREQIGCRRLRFNDDQRRRLAAKAKEVGRKMLAQVEAIVTPETLMAWHRKLIAPIRSTMAVRFEHLDEVERPRRSLISLCRWQGKIEPGDIGGFKGLSPTSYCANTRTL
jgi:hypothetical protein